MRVMVNGREIEVPTDSDGSVNSDAIRRAAGIPDDRVLIKQDSAGGNELVNPGDAVVCGPYQHLTDGPIHRRGETR